MITRRDFLNGMSLTIAAGLAPIDLLRAEQMVPGMLPGDYYPPALTGLRGSHPGSFEPAHAMAREGTAFDFGAVAIEEDYDLIIVGGGISGLSAAWFYREKHGADKKILIIDNHDDFGGHAKRNEFRAGDRLVIGYGGTESMESPRTSYSKVATKLLKSLAVDINRFTTAFDRKLYHSHKLSRGVFFDKDNWGVDKLVTGDPFTMAADDQPPTMLNDRPIKQFINDFPLSDSDKAALIAFHEKPVDYLRGKTKAEKNKHLAKTSYRDFLLKDVKLSERAALYFQGRFNDYFGSSSDTVSAFDAMEAGFPGFDGLRLNGGKSAEDSEEPYIYHFPDGNASIARLLVRSLIPAAATGKTMEDVVLAKFDYSKLDAATSPVRIRLNSIGLNVANVKDGVHVTYINAGKLHKVRAKKAILAGWNMLIPFIAPDLPEEQKRALRQNVKLPLVYTNVVIRNWHSFIKAGVHDIYSPTMPYARVKMDYPVSLGGYKFPKSPDEPICVHMYRAVTVPNQGFDCREQARMGRQILLDTPFEEMEHAVRDQLSRQLAGTGFDDSKDILGITVNRWPHGYSYAQNTLFEETDAMEATIALARKPFGNVAIANADSAWEAYTQAAIDQAWRAINELA